MSRTSFELRFGIESADGLRRSSTWGVAVRGDDVYLWCRETKHIKVSFHQSGACHEAISRAFVEAKAPASSPLRKQNKHEQWQRLVDPRLPLLVYRVLLNGSGVTVPKTSPRDDDVRWLREPPAGQHVIVGLVFAPRDWVGQGEALAHHDLTDGSRMWLRHWSSTWTFPEKHTVHPQYFGNHTKRDVVEAKGLRVLFAGSDHFGRFMGDAPVQWQGSLPQSQE